MRPAEGPLVGPQPDLEGVGGDAADAAEHVPPVASLRGQALADPAAHRRRDGEDELVEVLTAAQHLLVPVAGRARVGGELAAVGPAGKQGSPLTVTSGSYRSSPGASEARRPTRTDPMWEPSAAGTSSWTSAKNRNCTPRATSAW